MRILAACSGSMFGTSPQLNSLLEVNGYGSIILLNSSPFPLICLHRTPATTTPTHPSAPKGLCHTLILAHTRSYHKSFQAPTTIHETLPDACPYNCTSPPTIYLPSPHAPSSFPCSTQWKQAHVAHACPFSTRTTLCPAQQR